MSTINALIVTGGSRTYTIKLYNILELP